MSRNESDGTDGPRPTVSETYMMVTARLMQGVAVLLALVFSLIAIWSLQDIVRRFAYFELPPLLGFGAAFLGICAGLFLASRFILKKVRAQLADPNRID